MKSPIFWDITLCSPLKANRRCRGTFRLHLQGWRINRALLAACLKLVSCLLYFSALDMGDKHVALKFRLPFLSGLHGFISCDCYKRRSEWQRGLRHELSSPARTLGSWVRIPLKAWMSVRVYSLCVFLRVGRGLATVSSPVQGVLQTVYMIKKLKNGQNPTKGL
jgi:hypothetical protein